MIYSPKVAGDIHDCVVMIYQACGLDKKRTKLSLRPFLVRRKGLEPPTYWFVASHSIQLSYRRIDALLNALAYISTCYYKMQALF